jgi:acetyl esterase/lipase
MAAGREWSTRHRTADGGERPLLVFEPDTPARAGVVLFHGGAPANRPHCRELAARGFFAVSAGYHLLGQGAASIDDCLADVRLAVEQAGVFAAAHGLGADRLAWGGSSAGAHLALAVAMSAPTAPALVALKPAGLGLRALPPDERRRLERQAGIGTGRSLRAQDPLSRTLRRRRRRDGAVPTSDVVGRSCGLTMVSRAAGG